MPERAFVGDSEDDRGLVGVHLGQTGQQMTLR